MRNLRKRALSVLCAVMVWASSAGALAEFSPRYGELVRGKGAEATISAQADSLSPLRKDSLEIVNDWLSHMQVRCFAGTNTRAELLRDGEAVYALSVQKQSGYTLTSFSPSGNAYLTAPQGPDALALLAGGAEIPSMGALQEAYAAVAPALFGKLEELAPGKLTKEPTSIKNAAASAAYQTYTFKNGALNEIWPQLLDAALPPLAQALAEHPGWYARAEELLRGLEFSGECRFKRFLDKDGRDMGMQLTGRAARGDDARKVTLFGGYTADRGGYVSLSLPAVKGKNNLKASWSEKLTQKNGLNTLAVEAEYKRTMDGKTVSASLNGTLKNTIKDGDEHWTGKMTAARTENKVKTTWILTPDLAFTDGGLEGTINLQKKEGNTVKAKVNLQLLMRQAEEKPLPAAGSAKDLRGMGEAQARAAVQEELIPLAGLAASLAASLPEKDRDALLHDLRTDAWMNGPSVPAVESIQTTEAENSWEVEENEQ